jgi:hypothetical protein
MIKKLAGGFLAAGAVLVLAAPAAEAAPAVPFTINESFSDVPGENRFAATEPLCLSGTFVDIPQVGGGSEVASRFNLVVNTVYTCDDGGRTFVAHKHWHIVFSNGGFTNTGQIRFDGGTGEFTQLSGHGTINSESPDGNTGTAIISGVLKPS